MRDDRHLTSAHCGRVLKYRGRQWQEIGRRLRLACDLSQVKPSQLAFRTLAKQPWLDKLLAGQGAASDEELTKLGSVLGCTLEWILGIVPEQVSDYRADRHPVPEVRERLRTIIAMRRTTPEDNPTMRKPPPPKGPNITA